MSTTKSVVRIGGPIAKDKIVLLKHAIVSHFKSESSADNNASFTLRNKYFEADIVLQDLGEKLAIETAAIEDGVMLVFDALECNPDIANGSSFDELTAHHPEDGAGDLLRVCIGVSLGQWSANELRGQKEEAEYSKRILWCLDRGYEYVEVDLSQEGQQRGHDERDKEGFARLIEAIQGTVWSSAVMKTKQQQQEEREQAEKKKRLLEEEEKKKQAGEGDDGGANDGKEEPTIDSTYEPPILLKEPVDDDDEANTEQEKSLKQLEGLVHEAGRIREMSRSGQMGDDERRQRAADAATLMMGLMGLDDDDDDEVHDDSSEEEEN